MPRASRKLRAAIAATLIAAGLAGAARFTWSRLDPRYAPARREWASRAISTIDQRAGDKAWLDATLGRATTSRRWFDQSMIVARNGEWIVCENACPKEPGTPVRKDLFVGRGSDGRWYFSTFHFCVGRCVLELEEQPATLASFVDGYWLVPFDGKPGHCLTDTWTGGPWGADKLQAASR